MEPAFRCRSAGRGPGADPNAKWVISRGRRCTQPGSQCADEEGHGDALVAIYQNGERLMPGKGYPMRLLLPGYQGNMKP